MRTLSDKKLANGLGMRLQVASLELCMHEVNSQKAPKSACICDITAEVHSMHYYFGYSLCSHQFFFCCNFSLCQIFHGMACLRQNDYGSIQRCIVYHYNCIRQ